MLSGFVKPEFTAVADAFYRTLPEGQKAGGAALCVYYRGQPVVDIWAGSRNRQNEAWAADTLSLSFSTTKGIISTLLHQLVDQGAVSYDAPVAHYWPAFAGRDKSNITVRHLLTHEAGLYGIRSLIADASEMRDWEHMLRTMEAASPAHHPGQQNGYHALTYGWLVGGLIEKVTSQPLANTLKELLADPLNLDGCYIGVPDDELERCADLIVPERKPRVESGNVPRKSLMKKASAQMMDAGLALVGFDADTFQEAMIPKGMSRFDWNATETRQAVIPGAGGMFTARSLARIYSALAKNGEYDGGRILSPNSLGAISVVQNTKRGVVIPLPMRWRLGYHRVFTTGPRTPNAFGHFGYGGSGAWCDPSRELAVGYTVNYGSGSPFGDLRISRINTATINAAERVSAQ
ncbi:MAG: beta-lactamase family protein [Moraxellaceae bacterium]|nr:beta-lactamase family protein [Moraxellaceae bacterium]